MFKLLTMCACLGLIGLQAAPETLLVGTNAEFPPFCSIEKGEIVGFDIDIAKEVAKRLGKEIQLKDMPFDALIPALALGQVDFVAAGMSATEERAKRVLFTKNYLAEDPLVILSKQKLSLEDLQGKTVIVVEGFTSDLLMSAKKGINLVRLPNQADAFLALKNGRGDAFITAGSTVDQFFEKQGVIPFHQTPLEGTAETCALVIPKSKQALLVQIQKTLDAMTEDGTLDAIKAKWKLK